MISVARLECTMSFLHSWRTVFLDEYYVYVPSKLAVWGPCHCQIRSSQTSTVKLHRLLSNAVMGCDSSLLILKAQHTRPIEQGVSMPNGPWPHGPSPQGRKGAVWKLILDDLSKDLSYSQLLLGATKVMFLRHCPPDRHGALRCWPELLFIR